jgi:hypothetical protein
MQADAQKSRRPDMGIFTEDAFGCVFQIQSFAFFLI